MEKDNVLCAYSGILSSLKKKELLPHAPTWMNVEEIMLHEISQTRINTARFHLYEGSKIVKLTETE